MTDTDRDSVNVFRAKHPFAWGLCFGLFLFMWVTVLCYWLERRDLSTAVMISVFHGAFQALLALAYRQDLRKRQEAEDAEVPLPPPPKWDIPSGSLTDLFDLTEELAEMARAAGDNAAWERAQDKLRMWRAKPVRR